MSGSCALNAQGARPLASSLKKLLVGSTVEARGMISGSGIGKGLERDVSGSTCVALFFHADTDSETVRRRSA